MPEDRVVLLDEGTANRIAAGEVVERPASAVKELVENAIDAGATQVTVAIEEGGKTRIVVMDNGTGMTRSDAILALQRHATSKIRSADDLFAIDTLGFRGEALPSIASVSHLTMTTKPIDAESGTRILVRGGEIIDVSEVVSRDGTSIEVEQLFFNTPARLKFLKSAPAEVARSVDVIGPLAAAYSGISFKLRSGSNEIFSTPGTHEPLGALASIWGRDVARMLIPIHYGTGGLQVSGFIATPDLSRPGRSHELIFVNRRPIRSRLVGHALEDAFRALTPDSRYPIAAIFVEVDPGLVDVNVHPTKTEVKFTRDGEIHHAVSQAVKSALLAYGIVPSPRIVVTTEAPSPEPIRLPLGMAEPEDRFPSESSMTGYYDPAAFTTSEQTDVHPTGKELPAALLEGAQDGRQADSAVVNTDTGTDVDTVAPFVTRPRPRPFADQLRDFRVLGQARNTYIIALTPDGIAVVDQHVAHERVLYERLTIKRFSNGIPTQQLAVPVTLELGRREAIVLSEHCSTFAASGWLIEPFGRDSFALRAIPAILAHKPYEQVLRDMVDELVNQSVSRRLLVQQDHVTITNACKMAVKAGDPLNVEEMTGLLEQLAGTENPFLCPHGRPIVVMVPFHELDKQFKRA